MAIPGNNDLLGGDINAGYLGTVPASELITGNALVSLVGITYGTSINSNTDWLKFVYKGKIQFVSMKPIHHSYPWSELNKLNVVYGNKTVVIKGETYKIRLMRGSIIDPVNYNSADRGAIGSEWNKLMLPIHLDAPNGWEYAQFGGITEDWNINFSDADIGTASTGGSFSYTQDSYTSGDFVSRGGSGAGPEYAYGSVKTYGANSYGWRPVLEGPEWSNGPDLKANINGQLREYDDGWVMVDGQLRKLDKMWTKVNGILREV